MNLKRSKTHNDDISEIVKEIESKHGIKIDRRVVDFVATHPFLFTSERIRDPEDERAIRHRYLCIIAILRSKKNKTVKKEETTN